ncbi:MAG: helix-turn-helix domain-containing protein [Phycisphaerales bacterium]
MDLLNELRRAIKADPRAPGRIADEAGVARSQVSRFLNAGHGLSVHNAERIAAALGLRVKLEPKRKGR